jgi:hypothetical protein
MAGQPLRILKGCQKQSEARPGVNCYVALFFTKLSNYQQLIVFKGDFNLHNQDWQTRVNQGSGATRNIR